MKTFRKIGLAVMALITAVSLSACGDDDDEDEPDGGEGNGKVSATLGGKDFNLTHGYWYVDKVSTSTSGHYKMTMEFYNYPMAEAFKNQDYSLVPEYMNMLSIDYEIPTSQTSIQNVTVEGGDYHIYLVQGYNMSTNGWQGESWFGDENTDSPLVITRDGNNVTVKIASAEICQDLHGDNKVLKFNFSGSLSHMPEELQEH